MAVDATAVISQLLPPLVASSVANLAWWTEAELYANINDAANTLARSCVLVGEEAFIVYQAEVGPYDLPELFLAAIDLVADRYSRPQTSAAGLDAIDPGWRSTMADEVLRYSLDTDGPDKIRLYPAPTIADLTARLIYRGRLPDATALSPTMALPSCLFEYVWWDALGAAREKEGKAAMPDVAAVAKQVTQILGAAALDLWSTD